MKSDDLRVCGACGWYLPTFLEHRCRPEEGAAADRLANSVDVPSTKLGYGDGRLTFSVDDDLVMGFDVAPDGFQWRYLQCLADLSHDDAADLVGVLQAWRKRRLARVRMGDATSPKVAVPARARVEASLRLAEMEWSRIRETSPGEVQIDLFGECDRDQLSVLSASLGVASISISAEIGFGGNECASADCHLQLIIRGLS